MCDGSGVQIIITNVMSTGHETTSSLISNGLLLALDNPAILLDLQRLASHTGGDTQGDGEEELDAILTVCTYIYTYTGICMYIYLYI